MVFYFNLPKGQFWRKIKIYNYAEMATIDEIKKNRLQKLEALKSAGIPAYPGTNKRTHIIKEVLDDFSALEKEQKEIIVVGRIRSQRGHGGITFLNVEDGTGIMQMFFKKDRLGESSYKIFIDNFDIGDFIQVRGILFKTKSGEKTLEAADYKMLSKSLLPLPEKWHGLQDTEERLRKRYLDLIFNSEVKKAFETRSKIIKEIRNFLDKEGFLEVETPILQPIYGGASALPFKTHLNAQDCDMYLRIAPELYLKRLLVGGFEKVYEIGRVFRNEGVDRAHNPDFTSFEFYWAYADYKDLMKMTERMFEFVLKNVFGKTEIEYEEKKIDFKIPWQRITFEELLRKHTGIDFQEINLESLIKEAKKLDVEVKKGAQKAEVADEIYKKQCRPNIWEHTFIINYPVGFQALAKTLDDDPKKLANLQLVIAGWESPMLFQN
jgi:lysyl-tRNA synthetase class 2